MNSNLPPPRPVYKSPRSERVHVVAVRKDYIPIGCRINSQKQLPLQVPIPLYRNLQKGTGFATSPFLLTRHVEPQLPLRHDSVRQGERAGIDIIAVAADDTAAIG